MAQPKKRISSTRSGNRRSHLALKKNSLSSCPKCQAAIMPHRTCGNCGTYKGDQVINFNKKETKDNKKK